MSNIDLGLLGL